MVSIFQVWMRPPPAEGPAASDLAFMASTIHITIPPTSKAVPIIVRLSRCLPITLVSRKAGIAVTTKAMMVRLRGCVKMFRSPRSPRGKVERNLAMRSRKYNGKHRIAPNWITMVYIFQYPLSSVRFGAKPDVCSRASEIRRCAVELTGRNSVRPSTIPKINESR
jgi:hypothetical protein